MGFFLAIEGGDGSGKGTQTKILTAYLKSIGKKVHTVAFPRHGEFSSYYADQYLNGVYGGVNDVHADLASLPYAFDRFAASKEIRDVINNPNGFVIADRYVASNLAHQGTKFSDKKERIAYYERMMKTEYEVLGIPVPDVNIILLVPSEISQKNIDKKEDRAYTTLKRDIHEADANHLDKAKANYEELSRLYPDKFKAIDCMNKNGEMRSIEDIQDEIRALLDTFTDTT
ncbi:MAG: Thymidylate kinase [Candidatus Saccharibacteria bacterium]|nr:Thymidylate kinase [Candidatus Saccharibacteria bacterium]